MPILHLFLYIRNGCIFGVRMTAEIRVEMRVDTGASSAVCGTRAGAAGRSLRNVFKGIIGGGGHCHAAAEYGHRPDRCTIMPHYIYNFAGIRNTARAPQQPPYDDRRADERFAASRVKRHAIIFLLRKFLARKTDCGRAPRGWSLAESALGTNTCPAGCAMAAWLDQASRVRGASARPWPMPAASSAKGSIGQDRLQQVG